MFPSDSSPRSAAGTPLPNPFPVPESGVVLFFGPRRTLPVETYVMVFYLLLGIFHKAWAVMIQNHGIAPFPRAGWFDPEVQLDVAVYPRTGADGRTPLTTTSTVVDAAWGIIYYMLNEGVFGVDVSVLVPDKEGARETQGHILINQPYAHMGDNLNTTAPASAVS